MHVRKKLMEAYVRSPSQIKRTATPEGIMAAENMKDAVYGSLEHLPPEERMRVALAGGALAGKERGEQILARGDVRQQQIQTALNKIPELAYFGDHDAVHSITRVLSNINGADHETGPATMADLRFFANLHSYEPRRPQPEDSGSPEPEPASEPASEPAPDPDDFPEPRELDAEDARFMRRLSGQAPRLRGPEGGISRYYQ